MGLLEDLAIQGTDAYQASVLLLTISLIGAGIAIAIGRALQHRGIENFGKEELLQTVINGAIVGGIVVITSAITVALTSLSPAPLPCSFGTVGSAGIINPAISLGARTLRFPPQTAKPPHCR